MDAEELMNTSWYQELHHKVEVELSRLDADRAAHRPTHEDEINTLRTRIAGWGQSLAKPDLPTQLRVHIESDMSQAIERLEQLELSQQEHEATLQHARTSLDPQQVLDRLQRLADVIASNPTQGNLELSMVVDRISCFADGQITVRFCRLGLAHELVDELRNADAIDLPDSRDSQVRINPRRRALRRVEGEGLNVGDHSEELRARLDFAIRPDRFAGLPDSWFETVTVQVPKRESWASANASAVAELRWQGWTQAEIAKHFDRSIPTIREALRFAQQCDASLALLPAKMSRRR